jgi:hypothetical protein
MLLRKYGVTGISNRERNSGCSSVGDFELRLFMPRGNDNSTSAVTKFLLDIRGTYSSIHAAFLTPQTHPCFRLHSFWPTERLHLVLLNDRSKRR